MHGGVGWSGVELSGSRNGTFIGLARLPQSAYTSFATICCSHIGVGIVVRDVLLILLMNFMARGRACVHYESFEMLHASYVYS